MHDFKMHRILTEQESSSFVVERSGFKVCCKLLLLPIARPS